MSKRVVGGVATVVAFSVAGAPAFAQRSLWSNTGNRIEDTLGHSVVYVPDVDGDGVPDLLVGSPGPQYTLAGVVGKAILYSGATRSVLREFDGDQANDQFGDALADLGDVDGDGVRDFAISAPNRLGSDGLLGAIFVVSGNGSVIRTITGLAGPPVVDDFGPRIRLSWVGDVDGDGVRELLYNVWDAAHTTHTVVLVSGATGATIRTHSDPLLQHFGTLLDRAGDVDGDGVDDYALSTDDDLDVSTFSAATGTVLWKHRSNDSVSNLAPAGDVDLDGHADLLAQGWDFVDVLGGATGNRLGGPWAPYGTTWYCLSPSGDLNGDGRPDYVVGGVDGDTGDSLVDVFSGADGSLVVERRWQTNFADEFDAIDASMDVSGDGVDDFAVGNPYFHSDANQSGEAMLVSGVDGSTLATIVGQKLVPAYGASLTLVSDRDGDGWRDVAVVAPGGLEIGSPNAVQVVSGRDGHELSRFNTASDVIGIDGVIVSVGDVNGDGVSDLAIACPNSPSPSPPTNAVEIHSGADDSLLATIVPPSGTPDRLAAAEDVDGTPLLAVAVTAPDAVHLYDLRTNSLVGTYDGHGSFRPSCVGDVNGDGKVDWVVADPWNGGGAANVFSGGSSPKTLWSFKGSRSNPVRNATGVGDLDGDGFDDVLVARTLDSSSGKVTALSGTHGKRLFDLQGFQLNGLFGDHLATVGDVNRDGVCDFAIGGALWHAYDVDTVYLYSGKTAALLYRFDEVGDYGLCLANQRWHDDPRVGPEKVPDLVLGVPQFLATSGRAAVYELDDLMLQIDPPSPKVGDSVTATTRGGPPGSLVGLYALDLSGTPLDYFLALGTSDTKGIFVVTDTVPSSLAGETLTVMSYAVGFDGKLADSEVTAIVVQ
jgi:hypothetical protein